MTFGNEGQQTMWTLGKLSHSLDKHLLGIDEFSSDMSSSQLVQQDDINCKEKRALAHIIQLKLQEEIIRKYGGAKHLRMKNLHFGHIFILISSLTN